MATRKPRSHLSDTQRLTLQMCWQHGMTSQAESVVNRYRDQWHSVGLEFDVVKNWIGNRKMRKGNALYVKGTSAYNRFCQAVGTKLNVKDMKEWGKMWQDLSEAEKLEWRHPQVTATPPELSGPGVVDVGGVSSPLPGAVTSDTPGPPPPVHFPQPTSVEVKRRRKRKLIGQLEAVCQSLSELDVQVAGYVADKDCLVVNEFGKGAKFFQALNKHREFWNFLGFGNQNAVRVSTPKEREKESYRKDLQELLNAKYSQRVGYKTRIPYSTLEGKAQLVFTSPVAAAAAGNRSIPLKRPSSFGLSNLKTLLSTDWELVLNDGENHVPQETNGAPTLTLEPSSDSMLGQQGVALPFGVVKEEDSPASLSLPTPPVWEDSEPARKKVANDQYIQVVTGSLGYQTADGQPLPHFAEGGEPNGEAYPMGVLDLTTAAGGPMEGKVTGGEVPPTCLSQLSRRNKRKRSNPRQICAKFCSEQDEEGEEALLC